MSLSAAFTVNSEANPAEHIVAYGAVVQLALLSIVGADLITCEVVTTSYHGETPPAVTLTGTPLGRTAQFTVAADPGDGLGRSYRVKYRVASSTNGTDGKPLYQDTQYAIVGVPNTNRALIPLCPGEELDRDGTHGWTQVINIALNNTGGGGGGITTLGGDVTGASSTTVVSRLKGATVPTGTSLTVGNVLQVTGSAALGYGPVNLAGGANFVTGALPLANFAPGTNGQILATTGGVAAWATPGGDVTGAPAAFVVGRINGATVPASGALVTGNSLYASGVSALSYSALNLAGGSGWVTGSLPVANGGTGVSSLAAGVVHSNGTILSSSLIVDADITATTITAARLNGGGTSNRVLRTSDGTNVVWGQIVAADITTATITLDKLNQSSATSGQVVAWSGTAWVATTVTASGAGAVPTSRVITTTSPLTIGGGASADLSADRTIAISNGTPFQVLTAASGTGVAQWGTVNVGSSAALSGVGTTGQVAFANAGAIGFSAGLSFNSGTNALTVGAGGVTTAGLGTFASVRITGLASTMLAVDGSGNVIAASGAGGGFLTQYFATVALLEASPIAGFPDRARAIVQELPPGADTYALNIAGTDGSGVALTTDHVDYLVLSTPTPNTSKWLRLV